MDPQPRGPDWMPITPKTGSLFHADSHLHSHGTLELRNLEHAECRLASDPLNKTESIESR